MKREITLAAMNALNANIYKTNKYSSLHGCKNVCVVMQAIKNIFLCLHRGRKPSKKDYHDKETLSGR